MKKLEEKSNIFWKVIKNWVRKKLFHIIYLNAKNVGILVSTKPGQQKITKAIELKEKLPNKRKYLFIGNELDTKEFENFQLDCWINSACPRMDMNSLSIINIVLLVSA